MKISAVIFDLDGTILDDEGLYDDSFREVLTSHGVAVPPGRCHIKGIGIKENWVKLLDKYNLKTKKTPEILAIETQAAYLKRTNEGVVRPGFFDFAQDLRDSGVILALATSSTWEVAGQVMEKNGLNDFFDVVTTGDEVPFNKPDPDIFILSADKLAIERNNCLVIEDSPAGVTAAHRAGMKVIGIATTDEDSEALENAESVVQGFDEITPKLLDGIK